MVTDFLRFLGEGRGKGGNAMLVIADGAWSTKRQRWTASVVVSAIEFAYFFR